MYKWNIIKSKMLLTTQNYNTQWFQHGGNGLNERENLYVKIVVLLGGS